METIVPLLIQLVAGGVGGNAVGQVIKKASMGTTLNSVVGAVGGFAGTWLAGQVPALQGLIGSAGTMDVNAILGQGVAGLVGGGVLTGVAGMIKNNMAKK